MHVGPWPTCDSFHLIRSHIDFVEFENLPVYLIQVSRYVWIIFICASGNTHAVWHIKHFTHNLCIFLIFSNYRHCIQDLLHGEREFVKNLSYCINQFIPPIEHPNVPIFLKGKKETIFCNIKDIHEFHKG